MRYIEIGKEVLIGKIDNGFYTLLEKTYPFSENEDIKKRSIKIDEGGFLGTNWINLNVFRYISIFTMCY